jgi:cell division protease FtsH
VVAGLEKRNRVMNPAEKETVAYHEAGHALIAESRRYADRVSKISIIPRGIAALGYTQQLPTEDRYLLKRSELLDRLDVLLGGRVAEELVYGDISTGAQNDLQRATDMARHMITQYGMSERLGHVTFEAPRPSAFLNVPDLPQRAAYSESTARLIDEETAKLIAEAHERVKRTLTERRAVLDALAGLLLKQEVVERATLDELLKTAGGTPVPRAPEPLPLAVAAVVDRSGSLADAAPWLSARRQRARHLKHSARSRAASSRCSICRSLPWRLAMARSCPSCPRCSIACTAARAMRRSPCMRVCSRASTSAHS